MPAAAVAPHHVLDKGLVNGIDSKDNTLIPASANSTADKDAKPGKMFPVAICTAMRLWPVLRWFIVSTEHRLAHLI